MKIGIIGGTGPQGLGIGKRLAIEGEDVVIGSRQEEKAVSVVETVKDELMEYAPLKMVGMANEDAAKEADLIIMTVPLQAQLPTLKGIKEFCTDKIFLDATVPLETAIGGPVSNLLHCNPGSAAERKAKKLEGTGAKVISEF
ncbi:NAD(P)-binding domain-containing protein, partial [Methanobrevibacter woesei]|uniref:NAD(P)-binding domain-containing protein n=1 Tax=Methanobrevibacter woesei TaxID=190976 RepID=UPI0026E103CA